jgi:hypothetical protein
MAHHPDLLIVLMPVDVRSLTELTKEDARDQFMQKLTASPLLPVMESEHKEQLSFALTCLALSVRNSSSMPESAEWSSEPIID